MKQADILLQALEQEAPTTRRLLERVPNDKLTWRPHDKARTLGELALHVAILPGAVAEFVAKPSPVQAPGFIDPKPASAAELVPTLDRGIANAHKLLGGFDDAALGSPWTMVDGERELFTVTRGALLRSLMLNHWYHHRGQLSTYLRTIGVAIPSIYGPSADENPFI
jgi:uncharacterized damage-inducible protein DinB